MKTRESDLALKYVLLEKLGLSHSAVGTSLLALASVIRLKKNETLSLTQDRERRILFLLNGCFSCEIETPDARCVSEYIGCECGDVANPVPVLTSLPISIRCVALTDSCFLSLAYTDVFPLVFENTVLTHTYVRCLEKKLSSQAEHKYALSLRAEERYAWFLQNFGRKAEQIPQKNVAQYLYLDPSTLSRVKKQYERSRAQCPKDEV